MRNKKNILSRGKPKIAIVVDGETEAWYFAMLNRNESDARFQIKPEIPQRKSLVNQFEQVNRLAEDYDQVVWIVDMDVIIKETREVKSGQARPLDEFLKYKRQLATSQNVKIIINQPCIEYWFLLHFEFTQPPFEDCGGAEDLLRRNLRDYSKSQKYFTKEGNDIYLRLREKLPVAIENSKRLNEFDLENPARGFSEMHELFELLGIA